MMKKLLLVLLLVLSASAIADIEAPYKRAWCEAQGGRLEVVFPDRNRADCVTATHAFEVEFASKWKEAVGQSLNYAMLSTKRAGIVLIIGPGDGKYLWSLNRLVTTSCLQIDIFTVEK